MTAEIAVLNKTAVALATDSAVTISGSNQALKIFETADKLFQLSTKQPIGIMIYNGMQFLGVPFEGIIKSFRDRRESFQLVEEAANAFLAHLYEYVDGAPDHEIENGIADIIASFVKEIAQEILSAILDAVSNGPLSSDSDERTAQLDEIAASVIRKFDSLLGGLEDVRFIPRDSRKRTPSRYLKIVEKIVDEEVPPAAARVKPELVKLSLKLLQSSFISNGRTGIVFAGFGEAERFPTLISFEIDGVFEEKIRYTKTDHCDIDRNGRHAYVKPFAQKEMVDRFLHGLDDNLREEISRFCAETIGSISDQTLEAIEFADPDHEAELRDKISRAEAEFIRNLNERAFMSLEMTSRREIEDMVEFMPKPELARMAEALIDLTSIKRRVSEGLETVGGPVDVALISKHEGFVWVKRKHYFPKELNDRYFWRKHGENMGDVDE